LAQFSYGWTRSAACSIRLAGFGLSCTIFSLRWRASA